MLDHINASNLTIGKGAFVHPSASIRGFSGPARRVFIGDQAYIGADVQIICDEFSIGDYSKIHHHTNVHGSKSCIIGHNAWIGQYSIIDSSGGVLIGNNCGIGAHSQLWSHIKYGDVMAGCRFNSVNPLVIGDDVWLVGHCIVCPVNVEDKAMALVGSVVTQDMKSNEVYAGSPAVSITHKFGHQFIETSVENRLAALSQHLKESGINSSGIRLVTDESAFDFENETSYFCVSSRRYTKKSTDHEVRFMKYLLPEKGKFIPAQRVPV